MTNNREAVSIGPNGHVSIIYGCETMNYWITVTQVKGGRLSACVDEFFSMPQNQTLHMERQVLLIRAFLCVGRLSLSEVVDLRET